MLDEPRLAFSFMSRVPLGGKGNVRHVPRYFTLVGYLAGAVYYTGHRWMPGDIGTIATIVIGFMLFDLFHFDGLLDTFDGFLNQSGRDKCMEIMSKGDTGPFAVFFLVGAVKFLDPGNQGFHDFGKHLFPGAVDRFIHFCTVSFLG